MLESCSICETCREHCSKPMVGSNATPDTGMDDEAYRVSIDLSRISRSAALHQSSVKIAPAGRCHEAIALGDPSRRLAGLRRQSRFFDGRCGQF